MQRKLQIAVVSLYALENNGVRHIASTLRQAGFQVTEVYFKDWVNNNFPWPEEHEVAALIALLRERNVDVVGFSVRASAFHKMAKYLTERVRHALKRPIVWGGMHGTFVPDSAIEARMSSPSIRCCAARLSLTVVLFHAKSPAATVRTAPWV